MSLNDIPTSFGFHTFIRIFLPGFISAVVLTYICNPYYSISSVTDTLVIWIIFGIVIGMIVRSADLYIYHFFEGIRFWPSRIWWYQYKNMLNNQQLLVIKLHEKESQRKCSNDDDERKKLTITIRNISDILREYPNNRDNIEATRLGNVLADYETYSNEQYGMKFNIFWRRFWLIMPQEMKEEIELRSAEADFLVYISFIFLCSGFLIGIRLISLRDEMYASITQIAGGTSILCVHIIFAGIVLLAAILFLVISRTFYNLAVDSHKRYGKYIKSIIDIYRLEYAKAIGISQNLILTDDEKEKWELYGNFLQDYDPVDPDLLS